MKTSAERAEGVVLVLIVVTVGGVAGAASFTDVHDWTMANSPAGTGDWFGWANAAISELIPIAALLIIRRRRRTGGSIRYPMFLLIAAVILSLSAQLAVAKPGISGWLLSAVPALAFLGLSKLVFTTAPTPALAPVEQPAKEDQVWIDVAAPGGQADTDVTDDQTAVVNLPVRTSRPAVDQVNTTRPVDQVAVVEPVRPVAVVQRPGLVPVPATAFATRNGSPYSSEGNR